MPNVIEVKKDIERLSAQIELSSGQKPASEYRRAPWRHKWTAPATVEPISLNDSSEPLYVTICTISAHGLDFRSPRMFERGCKVLITLETDKGELQIPATVIHSTESVGMPIVGVSFDPG